MERPKYVDIPIVDAARRCGVQIKAETLGRREVEAVCPFCGDKLRRHHLSLNTQTDQYYCQLCGASGNSVSLYARLNNTSFADAARELLDEGNNIYEFPRARRDAETKLSSSAPCAATGAASRCPLAERHDVYYEMLSHLTLSENHISNLRERGLSDERIAKNMYRTLPDSEAARRFLAGMLADFHDLTGVPGFYTDKQGRWSITGKGGLLIPVCDKNGYIQGLQVRLDDGALGDDGRRYRWLSSRYKENGTKSGTWIHVTGNVSSKTAYLTEGPLKGDVASFHDNDALFICVAGINATDGLTDTIKSLGVTEIVLAADMDKVTNPQVRDGFAKIGKTVSAIRGVKVRSLDWNVCFKGIDDFYHVRRKAFEKGRTMSIRENGITAYVQELWQKEYPTQHSGWIGSCEWAESVRPLSELSVQPPKDLAKAQYYAQRMASGAEFPPIIAINGIVIDGLHRCWAYKKLGIQNVKVYQNKPFEFQEAA